MRYKYVSTGPGYSEFTTQATLYEDDSPVMPMSCPLPGLFISVEEKPSSISWKLRYARGRPLIFTGKGLRAPGKESALQAGIAGVPRAQTTHDTESWAGQASTVVQRQPLLFRYRQGKAGVQGLLYLVCYFHTWQVGGKSTKNH